MMSPIRFHSVPFAAGTLHSQMKSSELKAKFEQKKQAIKQEEKSPKQQQIEQIGRDMAQIRESNKIAALDGKLKGGGELSDEELAYLKEKNPELYQKAVEIKEERKAYRKELENCRSKEDVEKLHTRKLQHFAAQTKTIRENSNISDGKKREMLEQVLRRMAGIAAEHAKFIASEKGRAIMKRSDKKETLMIRHLPDGFGIQKERIQKERTQGKRVRKRQDRA